MQWADDFCWAQLSRVRLALDASEARVRRAWDAGHTPSADRTGGTWYLEVRGVGHGHHRTGTYRIDSRPEGLDAASTRLY